MREWWRHPRGCGVPGPKRTGTSSELGPVPGPRLVGLTSSSQGPSRPLTDARQSGTPQPRRDPRRGPSVLKLVLVTALLGDVSMLRCDRATCSGCPQHRGHFRSGLGLQPGGSEVVGSRPRPRHPSPAHWASWQGHLCCQAQVWAKECGAKAMQRRQRPSGPASVHRGARARGPSTAVVPQPGATWASPPPAVGSPSCASSLHLTAPVSLPGGGPGTGRASSWVADGTGSGDPHPGCPAAGSLLPAAGQRL